MLLFKNLMEFRDDPRTRSLQFKETAFLGGRDVFPDKGLARQAAFFDDRREKTKKSIGRRRGDPTSRPVAEFLAHLVTHAKPQD